MKRWAAVVAVLAAGTVQAQRIDLPARILPAPVQPSAAARPFVAVAEPSVAIAHVRVIDGTGAPAQEDRTVVIKDGRIVAIQDGDAALPADARILDARGETLLPGIVGLHDHLYYIARPDLMGDGHSDQPLLVPQMTFSAPRLYLAMGVTTMRTTGSVEPYADLNLKRAIDEGRLPGPHMDVTGPYLEGAGSPFIQMHPLRDAEDARRTVGFWADQGATSFKAYMNITRAELKAATEEAHRRGLKITGHLCSITYPEAAAIGIDDLEHGFWVNTQNDPGKAPDQCPATDGAPTLAAMVPGSAAGAALIRQLVSRHVAVTSTLPVFEPASPRYRMMPPRALEMLTPEARNDYLTTRLLGERAAPDRKAARATLWANELAMERAFAAAGGLLITGPDPTGAGNVLPGFGDLRAVELLVEAGFTPLEAIRIGTLNGAIYLGLDARIGSVAVGKDADLMLVRGDPSTQVEALEDVHLVFKDGVGYDTAALLASVRGRYGQY